MTQTMPLTTAAPKEKPKAPTCIIPRLHSLPGYPRRLFSYCPLPLLPTEKRLRNAFAAAPQFADIDVKGLLAGGDTLRVILLTENDYYARQAAMYMAALAVKRQRAQDHRAAEEDDFWAGVVLDEGPDPDENLTHVLQDALAVVSPGLLSPEQRRGGAHGPALALGGQESCFDLRELLGKLELPALMVAASTGEVLTDGLMDQLDNLLGSDSLLERHLFVALRPSQVNWQLIEELRFSYGFQICRVGLPDRDYLRRVLLSEAEELYIPLSGQFDADAALTALQRYRGADFTESDLPLALIRAAQGGKQPLKTKALAFAPYRHDGTAKEQLQRMVGLENVKDALRRLLGTALLDERRRLAGKKVVPSHRSMAFSGPPGTGKSVTARLVARIMMEEGVGSGRFVEAGREQLIGQYLGQTSPQVAKLFEQARGGVLFIDEAGALLDDGHDTYAAEAVNAIVRHMELSPETVVIFATYPGEMERLLNANPGLSSRVAQVLRFDAYDDAALWEILNVIAAQEGFAVPADAKDVCTGFFRRLREKKGDNFGNGREARRLFQSAKEELALRSATGGDMDLTASDLRAAAERLLDASGGNRSCPIGF